MKKVLIIILAVLIAATGGLLVYSATRGEPEEYHQITHGLLAEPPANIKEGAAHWYDVSTMLTGSSAQEKAANLLVYTAYNHINVSGFYFAAHVDVSAKKKYTCSDYYRTQQGVNTFYEAFAYTGKNSIIPSTALRRLDYVDQRVSVSSASVTYDLNEKVYTTTWDSPKTTDTSLSLRSETPYTLYSWYDLPLDMGDDVLDFSLISDQVTIDSPTSQKPYYVLTFSADVPKAKDSAETLRRLKEGTGNVMSKIDLMDLTYKVEIWPCGLFRHIEVYARVVATVTGAGRGDAEIKRYYDFSYDALDCSVALKFENSDLTKELKEENQERIKSEVAALPQSTEEEPQA